MGRRNLIRFLLVLLCGLAAIVGARLAYSIATCTITGTVLNLDGSACALCTITFDPGVPQPIVNGGQAYTSQPVSTTTDSLGNLTAISLPQGLVARVSIAQNGASYGGFSVLIPAQSSVTFSTLLLGVTGTPIPTPTASPLPAGSQLFTATGNFTVPPGVNGIMIECWGAGGGGGGYGTGTSGGNGTATTVTISAVTVCGAGGGLGGILAAVATAGAGGNGGAGTTGTLVLNGQHGGAPFNIPRPSTGGGGEGGYPPRGGLSSSGALGEGGSGGGPNNGSSGGGGGGAGGYANTVVVVTPGQVVNITIGTGGTGGTGSTTNGITGANGMVLITWGS